MRDQVEQHDLNGALKTITCPIALEASTRNLLIQAGILITKKPLGESEAVFEKLLQCVPINTVAIETRFNLLSDENRREEYASRLLMPEKEQWNCSTIFVLLGHAYPSLSHSKKAHEAYSCAYDLEPVTIASQA